MMSTGEYKGVATNQHVRTTAVDPVATNQHQNTTATKVCFYIAQYPVRWTAQSALHFTPGRPVHSGTNSASLGSILATQQLGAKTSHSHFNTVSSQVLICTAELGRHG